MKDRKDIDSKYKWDLSVIYKDEDGFKADFAAVEALASSFSSHEALMCESAEGLLATLTDLVAMTETLNKLWTYAYLSFATNNSDNSSQARVAKVRSLAVTVESAAWFVSPYILRLDEKTVEEWYKTTPALLSFRRMIEKGLREKPYTLSDDCEKLIANLGDSFDSHGDIRGIFANSDLQFGMIRGEDGKKFRLTDTNYVPTLMSGDRGVRRSAFKCLYKTYEQFSNTFATLYYSYVKEQCNLSKIRGYKSSLDASTFRDEVTPKIYNSLIKSVRKSLPVIHDYYELKREVLGVERLHMYDVYAPLIGECEKPYTYEEAVDEVLSTVKVFGKEYYNTLSAGLCERGWVDVYPSKGKQGGAFSAGCPKTEPYILLNFSDRFDDVSTLAHEAGHSMHSYFSRKYNEPHNSQYTIFVAEVASTVNELLLAHRKLKECKSDNEKLYILNQLMETFKATLFRQTMFAEFERDMHALCEKGVPLTQDTLCKSYYDLVKLYFGPSVICDKEIADEWMRIPHFYNCFYVYKYATCISAASAIVKRIETEGEAYIAKYIDFLKCGGSKSPLDSLLVAGIDMRKPEVVRSAIEDFAATVEQFKELYSKTNK